MKIQEYVSLANFTTWKVGGPAEWFAEPTTIHEIKYLINWAKSQQINCQIIGAGSNLLINDAILPGLTICLKKFQGSAINSNTGIVEANSGEPLPTLSRRVAKAGLHGLEWAVGIPGTVGGAAFMNAGAQGNCTSDILQSIQAISLKGGDEFKLSQKELNYSYRKSRLQQEEFLVLSVRFKLEAGHDKHSLNKVTTQNLQQRLNSQPYDLPSCGSVFRNPKDNKAGQLIESLGLKGFRIGGAEISKVHANFIVNSNDATANDISQLILVIQEKVKQSYGILLLPEVKKLGF